MQNASYPADLPYNATYYKLTQAPILPAALAGAEKAFSSLARLTRAPVTVAIGEPFHLPPVDGSPRGQDLAVAAELIVNRLASLLPEEYRGIYAQPSQLS